MELSPQFRVWRRTDEVRDDSNDPAWAKQPNRFEVWNGPGHPTRPLHTGSETMVPDTTMMVGRPMPHDELPDEVYHVTTDVPGVNKSGVVLAHDTSGQHAGLGGSHAKTVSVTVDPEVAHGIEDDMRNYAMYAASKDVRGAMTHLHGEYEKRGMLHKFPDIQRQYEVNGESNPGDTISSMFNLYYNHRLSHTGERNPVLLSGVHDPNSHWYKADPDKVGTIAIPRSSIPKQTLVSSFDIGNPYGLEEARVHGDIPLRQVRR